MNNNELTIEELHELLVSKKIDSKDLISSSINKAKELNGTYNGFVTILDNATEKEINDNYLSGIPVAIKDNLSTKGILTTASSNTLKDYIPFYDATCIKKLKEANAIIMGKTVMDELGMGGSGTTGHTGTVRNPWDKTRITAGSSAGSAYAVSAGIVSYALGSDTGDSIRKPASYTGIVGYKPTYGMVSRYGLFPFASSLDHVGVLTRSVKDAAIVIDTIKGKDENDMTTFDSSNINLYKSINGNLKHNKIFYIKELCDISNYPDASDELKSILNNFKNVLSILKNNNVEVIEESFPIELLKAIYPTYLCISCAEATSNDSNLTGLIFGPRGNGKTYIDVIKDHRTKGFSPLIKRRFIIGSYVLQKENQEKYFLNAKRVRRLITDRLNKLFEVYDGLVLPCSDSTAKNIENSSNVISRNREILDNHMAMGNFGGYPSITIPSGIINGLPIGINITGKVKDDINVLNLAYLLESNMDYKNMIAKEVR